MFTSIVNCTLKLMRDWQGECQLNTVGFGGNSRYLVTGGSSQLVYIWDLKKQTLAKSLKVQVFGCRSEYFFSFAGQFNF